MIPPGTTANILNTIGPQLMFMFVVTALACAALIYFFRQKDSSREKDSSFIKRPPGLPPRAMLGEPPKQKAGGQRTLDSMTMSPESQAKRKHAQSLIAEGKLREASLELESVNLQREAIDLLEGNGLIDDAAAMLMRMNRPNRAAVVYERNQRWEQAAVYYLKAKLVADSKRCCKQIKEFSVSLSIELAVLFAEAGDNKSAIRLLAGINDKARILKIVREKFAYEDLAEFLDLPAARQFILKSIHPVDIAHMLQHMPDDGQSALNRAQMWVQESEKSEWLIPIFIHIGDNRGVASEFAKRLDAGICDAFAKYILSIQTSELELNKQAIEWAARAFHDAYKMLAAAKLYEKLNQAVLAGKCWAIGGNSQRATSMLTRADGDPSLAGVYQQELDRLGRFSTDAKPLEDHERDSLSRLFSNIDPDTEKNRTDSPFSIAS